MRTIDLNEREYERSYRRMRANGARLYTDDHEGSTLALGPVLLCESDGYYWLAIETQADEAEADWPSDWCWADDGAIEFAAA